MVSDVFISYFHIDKTTTDLMCDPCSKWDKCWIAPRWLMLRKKLEKEMQHRYLQLGTKLIEIDHQFLANEGTPDNIYLQESAIIGRINFLDRLKIEFGQKQGRSVLLRLLIPTATMGWKFFKPFYVG
jgi:hypothetical protein